MDYTTRTRKDWETFDSYRAKAFEPTPEELAEQARQQEEQRQAIITWKLKAMGITRPDVITKEFVLWLLIAMNAQEFVGKDLSEWIDNQEKLFGSLDLAFDELLIRYV